MCPRPRTASDADLLAAAARAVGKAGPSRLTLAGVGREAGVAPATLVQRFGSKRGLLLALARAGGGAAGEQMAALRASHPTPLAALYAFADCMAGMERTPAELANHLAFLHVDLTDPEFHRHALVQARAFQAGLRELLDEAVAAGELARCDTESLARLVQQVLNGALVTWAVFREGTARDWVRREVDALLRPYLAATGRSRVGAKRKPPAGGRG